MRYNCVKVENDLRIIVLVLIFLSSDCLVSNCIISDNDGVVDESGVLILDEVGSVFNMVIVEVDIVVVEV